MRAPPTSSWGASLSADSGTNRRVPTIAIAASTTLSAKTDCHDQTSSSSPVISRPAMALPPATPAQTPTARVRCCGGKVPVMVERVAGITSAAPRPSTPRSAMSCGGRAGRHGDGRSGAEDGQPDEQCPPPAVAVADRTSRQQQRGKHQRVRVDDPGELGLSWRGCCGRCRAARRSARPWRRPRPPAPRRRRRSPCLVQRWSGGAGCAHRDSCDSNFSTLLK